MPRFDCGIVALSSLRLRQLHTLAKCSDDAADMSRMIGDGEELFDDGGDAFGSPNISNEAEGGRTLGKGSPKLLTLVAAQARSRAWGSASAQSSDASIGATLDPLADSTLRHAQSSGDDFLFPAELVQVPGAKASTFAPVDRFLFELF
jgi:hypothetical protein